MPASSTLALGQAQYELLEALGETTELENQQISVTVRADRRGGSIDGLGIGFFEKPLEDGGGPAFSFSGGPGTGLGKINALNIADKSSGLIFNDLDVQPGFADSNANINFLGDASGAEIALGSGDNRLNASRNFRDATISGNGGGDTVRIGGDANSTLIALGDGNNQVTVSRATTDLDVDLGAGDDNVLFLGSLTSSSTPTTNFPPSRTEGSETINQTPLGNNIINTGDGDDVAKFMGGIRGQDANGDLGYEINLGGGDDVASFGANSYSDNFILNTGTGSDKVTLGKETVGSILDLGWGTSAPPAPPASGDSTDFPGTEGTGDTIILGAGSLLSYSEIRSGQQWDRLEFRGSVENTTLDMGWGNSDVIVDGDVSFTDDGTLAVWDLGAGNDVLDFSSLSSLIGEGGFVSLGDGADSLSLAGTGFGIEFDLGSDGDIDVLRFAFNEDGSLGYSDIVISNFGQSDILYIGAGKYGYGYEFLNSDANEFDLNTFQLQGNVIWQRNELISDSTGPLAPQTLMTLDTAFTTEYVDGIPVPATNADGEPVINYTADNGAPAEYVIVEQAIVSDLQSPMAWGSDPESVSDTSSQPQSQTYTDPQSYTG